MHVVITTDGEAKPNPGRIRIGVIVEKPYREGTEILSAITEDVGWGTNNEAEYKAILRGLNEANALGASSVVVYTDSQLCDRQLRGVYAIKNKSLKKIHSDIKAAEKGFDSVKYRWHRRDSGRGPQADALAKGGKSAQSVMEALCLTTLS